MIEMNQLQSGIVEAASKVRANNPMAGSITNSVTIDFVANAQLAVGGSAAMVYLPDEGECLVAAGGAVYINMGPLLPVYEETLPRTAAAAHAAGKPWVLDPVGIGIGSLRTKLLRGFKPYKPAIVRGNASEIIALAGLWDLEGDASELSRARGVDTTDTVAAARDAAVALARYTGGAVAISGESDLVTDGSTVAYSTGGSALMSKVTGFGRPLHRGACRRRALQRGGNARGSCGGRAREFQGCLHRRALPRNARRYREQPAAHRGGLA